MESSHSMKAGIQVYGLWDRIWVDGGMGMGCTNNKFRGGSCDRIAGGLVGIAPKY